MTLIYLHSMAPPPRSLHVLLLALALSRCVGKAEDPVRYSVAFDRDQYAIVAGASFPVEVHIVPTPPPGLFSFGIRLLLPPNEARVQGAEQVLPIPELSTDGTRAENPVLAIGAGYAAAKGTASFDPVAPRLSTNGLLARFIVKDLGGSAQYTLGLEMFNTLGPTEQIFVDGDGTALDTRIVFRTAQVVRDSGDLEVLLIGGMVLNRQSGLFEQRVQIRNTLPSDAPWLRLWASALPEGWTLANAHGVQGDRPFVLYGNALPSGNAIELVLEFRVKSREPSQQPVYTVDIPAELPPASTPASEPFRLDARARLSDGSFLIEFDSLPNRFYLIQYTDDLITWLTALPEVTGTGSRVQWIDHGPPKTITPPGAFPTRYYRVFLIP